VSRLDQSRAAFALARVESLLGHSPKDQAKYKTQLLKLPARLHTNGLGQTVAFYLSAGASSPEATICTWLEGWLRQAKVYPKDARLIDCITGTAFEGKKASGEDKPDPLDRYRQAAAEARALTTWLKRFAEAFIQAPEDDSR
jgi:CRISPR-associated protein Cmr5